MVGLETGQGTGLESQPRETKTWVYKRGVRWTALKEMEVFSGESKTRRKSWAGKKANARADCKEE